MTFRENEVLASIVKESFYEFVKEFWHIIVAEPFVPNWHIEKLCDELQEAAERVFKKKPRKWDYVINVPPGSSKSTICSQLFPAWVWARFPPARFICGSYAQEVALKDSVRTRDVVQSDLYQQLFPYIQLREDQNTKGLFVNTQKGDRFSVGVNGAVTGFHAHFIMIDDPLNPEEAYSDAELKVANRWIRNTLSTRKVDKAVTVTILIQQRLHQADPSGDMLDRLKKTGKVRHICLPGEITEGAEVSPPEWAKYYTADGLMDPVRITRETLEALKEELGEYGYASQILQNPVPLGGGMFKVKWLQMEHDAPTEFIRMCRSWDKAGTKDGGAWSVGILMGVDKNKHVWILDVVRGQWASADRENMIQVVAQKDEEDWGDGVVEIVIELEGGSGGKESGENSVRNLIGYRVYTYHPTGHKEARAYPFSSQVGNKTVHCLIRPWTTVFKEELQYFPHSRYKDQVDAASGGFNRIARKKKRIGGV